MSTTQFFCRNTERWKLVKASNEINGIDYLEVSDADQQTLIIHFLHNLPGRPLGIPSGPPLTKDNIFIEGGVRVKGITVTNDPILISDDTLSIRTSSNGDFSNYVLMIGNSSTNKDGILPGFDQQLSSIDFSFKINCPNEFDCSTGTDCQPAATEEPVIDYLAKDYSSFKRLMLDRLSTIMPDWKERNAADLQIVLVELFAYIGDQLSYYQDAVATETYLNTARRRISLKRHSRLLDYFVHDGCNARVWVNIEIQKDGALENQLIEKGTALMTNGYDDKINITAAEIDKFINEQDPVIFETMHEIRLQSAHNRISFYTWGDDNCCLPAGATRATLNGGTDEKPVVLKIGDVLIFEEVYGPASGKKTDADPAHRHAVRIKTIDGNVTIDTLTKIKIVNIEWHEEDALPFSLCLTSAARSENEEDGNKKSFARGNTILADHGYTMKQQHLKPAMATGDFVYYPQLPSLNNTVAEDYEHVSRKITPAALSIIQNPHKALPVVILQDDIELWKSKKDLLASDRFAPEFTVEMEQDGRSYLRFGDDICGKKPTAGFSPRLSFRTGSGRLGNVGTETINAIVRESGGIEKITNLLPAAGGKDPETMEEIRQFAPRAFRTQQRAVTASDYIQKTELHPEVQKAAAKFYWTGSWYTVFIIIDRKSGKDIDDTFKETIRRHLEQYRMAAYDLEIKGPRYVPLYIEIEVCVKEGYFRSDVKKRLIKIFSNAELPDGKLAFFHPDNFTFGQPVYLSAIYEAAMNVTGVGSIEIKTFRRWAKNAAGEIRAGFLKPSELEIIRLDNDSSLPENGKIEFTMFNGL